MRHYISKEPWMHSALAQMYLRRFDKSADQNDAPDALWALAEQNPKELIIFENGIVGRVEGEPVFPVIVGVKLALPEEKLVVDLCDVLTPDLAREKWFTGVIRALLRGRGGDFWRALRQRPYDITREHVVASTPFLTVWSIKEAVRRWLRRHCPSLAALPLIWADDEDEADGHHFLRAGDRAVLGEIAMHCDS